MSEQDNSGINTGKVRTDSTGASSEALQRRSLLQILGTIGAVGSTAQGVGGTASQTGNSATTQQSIISQTTSDWRQQTKLFADDGESGDSFGKSVALTADSVLIGAPGEGSAYVFRRSDGVWTQQAKLIGDDGDGSTQFGESVSLDGEFALIGDPAGTGSAYVFRRSDDTWTRQTKLTADDGDEGDEFGTSVSLDSEIALIGASRDTVSGDTELGSAYVFERSNGTWTRQAKLVSDEEGFQSEWFGTSVAVDGETALIGAPVEYDSEVGSAYVFRRADGVWTQQERLVTDEAYLDRRFDRFGSSVALDDGTALVGSAGYNSEAGSAYVFRRSDGTWTQQAELVDDDLVTGDQFGASVALDGDSVCIGGEAMGAAYVFRRIDDTWTQQAKLVVDNSDDLERTSTWVALDGKAAYVGVPDDSDSSGEEVGSTYVFDRGFTEFETAVKSKLGVAEDIDEVAIYLSELEDVKSVISGHRESLYDGEIHNEVAEDATTRLRLGEEISHNLLINTSDETAIEGVEEANIAVDTTRFSIDLGVSLALSQLALVDVVADSRFGYLIPNADMLRQKLDTAIGELIGYTFSQAMQCEALSEINSIVQEGYDRILDAEFDDFESFFVFISDSVSATVANLTIMQTIETGGGFVPRSGPEFTLIDSFANVESSLDYLNKELKAESLVNQGLDGTKQGMMDAHDDAEELLDQIASTADTFLFELNERIDIPGILENVFDLIDGILNGDAISTVDAVTLVSLGLLPKASLAITTVQIIGKYVGEFSIRLMMTTHAWGIAGIQRGDPISLADIDTLVPDIDSVLEGLDPTEDRWGEFA